MILRRKSIPELLESTGNLLNYARLKLMAAYNVISNSTKGKALNESTLVSAMAGIPLLPEFTASMYLSGASSDIRKAQKNLQKICKALREVKDEEYKSTLKPLLNTVIESLSEIEDKLKLGRKGVIEAIELLNETIGIINEITSHLRG